MDWTAIALSVRLAAIVSVVLLVIGLPIAYWLTFSASRARLLWETLVTLPLVLPPTVLAFYVQLPLGSRSPIRRPWPPWTGQGLAVTPPPRAPASNPHSLPFAV